MFIATDGAVMAPPVVQACIPTNNLLIGPIQGPLGQIAGGIGGLVLPFLGIVLLVCLIAFIFTVLRREGFTFLQKAAYVVAGVIGFVLLSALGTAIFTVVNNSANCGFFNG